MLQRFWRGSLIVASIFGAVTTHAQTFAGSDDFSGGDAKWAYFTRLPGVTNGTMTFTGSVLEFTKSSGAGSYILGWDGDRDGSNTISRTTASFTTSWVMNVSATNQLVAESGKYASIGIEASNGPGAYTAVLLTNISGRLYVVGENNAIGANVSVAVPTNADVRLRLGWDAAAKKFTGSYSFDAGATYKVLLTTLISAWPTSPATTGFYLEAVGNATTAAAIPSGKMQLDNFAISGASTFAGSDDFSGSDGKWAFTYQLGYLTDGTNGAMNFTGSVAEFTKGAGKGSSFMAWDGDGLAGNTTSRIAASYTTSWVMDVTATNKARPESGTFGAIGLQLEVGPGAYAEINVSTTSQGAVVRVEAVSPDDPGVNISAPTDTNVKLRIGWNASTKLLTFSYSFDGGTTYSVARTLGVTNWATPPTGGFWFELEAFSTSASPIAPGLMQLDNFSITAVPSVAAPAPLAIVPGTPIVLSAVTTASATASVQWQLNGSAITTGTSENLVIQNAQPEKTGLYQAQVSNVAGSTTTLPTIVGLDSTEKVVGSGHEIGTNIVHPNKNVFDQVLLEGAAASITADSDQITRMSFIDDTNDIVQIEFAGHGTVSLVLDGATGPALPANYNQDVTYMKGHAGIVVTGADETSNLSVFSVGRGNAVNQALFKDGVAYDGWADIAFVAISSVNGKFGGLRTANANYFAAKGVTGLYAPGVQFVGPVYIGDINAYDAATPMLVIGAGDTTQINGGDLLQTNGRAVQVSGLTQLKFVPGSTSHSQLISAKQNLGHLEDNGVDVTTSVVVNP